MNLGQLAAEFLADGIDLTAEYGAVGPGEIDKLKNTGRGSILRSQPGRIGAHGC